MDILRQPSPTAAEVTESRSAATPAPDERRGDLGRRRFYALWLARTATRLHQAAPQCRIYAVRLEAAVEVINETILERHVHRIIEHDNRARRIGEHSRGSKIQSRHSPVEPRDLEIVLSRVKDGKLQIPSQVEHKKPKYTIHGTPIREHGLKRDRFSMIVPDGAPGAVRKSSSPSRQARKRRRVDENDSETSAEPEELRLPTPWHQPAPASTYTTDSEMTEFVEEGPSGSPDADCGSDANTRTDEDELRSNADDLERLTPEPSVRETRNSPTPSPLQSACASQDAASDPNIG